MPIGFKEFGGFFAKATVVLIPLAGCTPILKSSSVANGNLRLSCHVVERIPEVEISDKWQSRYLPDNFQLKVEGNKTLLSIGNQLVKSDSPTADGKFDFVIERLPTSSQTTTTIYYVVNINMTMTPVVADIELRPNNLLKLMTGKAICKSF
jgi:hypothetical protein